MMIKSLFFKLYTLILAVSLLLGFNNIFAKSLINETSCYDKIYTKGFFVGGQIGESKSHFNYDHLRLGRLDIHNEGLGFRVFGGYLFNNYLGIEGGYLRFDTTEFTGVILTTYFGEIKKDSFDLMLKALYPFSHGFGLIGKVGIGYVRATPDETLKKASINHYVSGRMSHYRPMGALGIYHIINDYLSIDASMTIAKAHRTIQRGDLIAFGLIYSF